MSFIDFFFQHSVRKLTPILCLLHKIFLILQNRTKPCPTYISLSYETKLFSEVIYELNILWCKMYVHGFILIQCTLLFCYFKSLKRNGRGQISFYMDKYTPCERSSGHTIFGTWVHHHDRMCQVHSWSWYDIDLWPQGQIYRVYDMALCSGLSFFVLWHSHTLFGTWVYHHGKMCRSSPLTSISKLYFQHGFESGKMSLLFDIGIPNFGIWVYYHETTCCVHSWP